MGFVTPNDPRDVFYLVGFLEYGQALQRFDALLASLSPGELEAVEQIVLADNRLAFDTNLSRRMEQAPGPLSEPPAPAGEGFRRHSLAWAMALARVEVASMLAAFSQTPKPFSFVKPSGYEASAYRELLLDGLRTHFLLLPPAKQWRQIKLADNRGLLSMQRRLTLMLRFAEAVLDAGIEPAKTPAVSSVAGQLASLQTYVEGEIRNRMRPVTGLDPNGERKTYSKEFTTKRPAPREDSESK